MFPFLGPCQLSLASEKVYIWVALNIISYLMKHPQNWSSSHRDSFLSPSPSLQPLSLHLCDCVVIPVIVVNTVSVCSWLVLVCIAVRGPSCCRLWQDFHLKTGIQSLDCVFFFFCPLISWWVFDYFFLLFWIMGVQIHFTVWFWCFRCI